MIKLRSRYLRIVFLYFCLGAHPEIEADATLLSMMDRGVSSSNSTGACGAGDRENEFTASAAELTQST